MKTILITRFPFQSQFGGEELHTLNLAKSLQKRGFRVVFFGSDKILLEEFKKQGNRQISIRGLPFFKPPVSKGSFLTFTILSPIIFIYFFLSYWQINKKFKPDVIYMLSLGEKLLLTPIILFFKKIESFAFVSLRTDKRIIWIEHARIGNWLLRNPWRIFYYFWSHFVKIICVSEQSKKSLPWCENAIVIANGIDLNEFKKIKKLEFELQKFKIGFIGRLSDDKGCDILIKAVKDLKNIELLIVGKGIFEENLKNLAKDNSNIKFLGKLSRQEILDFYQNLDLFVLPSKKHDPFGLVIAEAMAFFVPTIVTNVCGITDYLENEVNTKIIPANNAESLKTAIEWYRNNPEKSLKIIEKAHKKCFEKFDLEKMVDSYEKIFLNN